jgi:hypothetical protein
MAREAVPHRWYLLLISKIFSSIGNNSELYDAERAEPILATIRVHSLNGIDALSGSNVVSLLDAANGLTDAFCVTAHF